MRYNGRGTTARLLHRPRCPFQLQLLSRCRGYPVPRSCFRIGLISGRDTCPKGYATSDPLPPWESTAAGTGPSVFPRRGRGGRPRGPSASRSPGAVAIRPPPPPPFSCPLLLSFSSWSRRHPKHRPPPPSSVRPARPDAVPPGRLTSGWPRGGWPYTTGGVYGGTPSYGDLTSYRIYSILC